MTKYHVEFDVESSYEWGTVSSGNVKYLVHPKGLSSGFTLYIPSSAEITVVPEPNKRFPVGSVAKTPYSFEYVKDKDGWRHIEVLDSSARWEDHHFTYANSWYVILSPKGEVLFEGEGYKRESYKS